MFTAIFPFCWYIIWHYLKKNIFMTRATRLLIPLAQKSSPQLTTTSLECLPMLILFLTGPSNFWFVSIARVGFWTWIWPTRHGTGVESGSTVSVTMMLFMLFLLNWIGSPAHSLLVKVSLRKLELWFVLQLSLLLILPFILVNLP